MHFKLILLLFFFSLLLISCSSCKTEKDDKMGDKLEKVTDIKIRPSEHSKLPPGTVKVRTLTNSIKIGENGLANIIIDGVLGYGSSTPVISKSETVSVKINDKQKEKIIDNNDSLIFIIKKRPPGRGEEDSNIWQLILIEE